MNIKIFLVAFVLTMSFFVYGCLIMNAKMIYSGMLLTLISLYGLSKSMTKRLNELEEKHERDRNV